jgi:hypothetical protein
MPVSKLLRLCSISVEEQHGLCGVLIRDTREVLQRFGIFLCQLPIGQGEDIVSLARNSAPGSVILFSVRWTTSTGARTGHAMTAWKDALGNVYIIDRTAEATGRLVRSLAELDALFPNSGYTGIANSILQEAYRLENCAGGFVVDGTRLLFAIGFTTAIAVQGVEVKETNQAARR